MHRVDGAEAGDAHRLCGAMRRRASRAVAWETSTSVIGEPGCHRDVDQCFALLGEASVPLMRAISDLSDREHERDDLDNSGGLRRGGLDDVSGVFVADVGEQDIGVEGDPSVRITRHRASGG